MTHFERLRLAFQSQELEEQTAIHFVAICLRYASDGDRYEYELIEIGLAMKRLTHRLKIPRYDVSLYLKAALQGSEWDSGKVRILFSRI